MIARYARKGSCIETGWSTADGETLADATTGYTEGEATVAGVSFARFLISVGVQGQFDLVAAKAARSTSKPAKTHRRKHPVHTTTGTGSTTSTGSTATTPSPSQTTSTPQRDDRGAQPGLGHSVVPLPNRVVIAIYRAAWEAQGGVLTRSRSTAGPDSSEERRK